MSLVVRVGRSFVEELRRPATLGFLIFAIIFLVAGTFQLTHNWTNETRPLWVDIALTLSPMGFLGGMAMSPAFESEKKFSWKRFGALLVIHPAFMAVYFGFFRRSLHLSDPMLTWSFFVLIALELGLLIFLYKKFFAAKPTRSVAEGQES